MLSYNYFGFSSYSKAIPPHQRTVIKNGVGIIGFFEKDNPASDYCCGLVGVGQVAFCLKKRGQCDVAIHKSSKFEPKPFHYYIQQSSTGGTAWCQPCVSELALHKLPNAERHCKGGSATL